MLVTIWTVIFGIALAFFKIQNKLMKGGIRPDEAMEIEGMDMPEMGAYAYVDETPEVDADAYVNETPEVDAHAYAD